MELKRLIGDVVLYADNGDVDRFRSAVRKLACYYCKAGDKDFAEYLELLVSRGYVPQTEPPAYTPFVQDPCDTFGPKDGTRLTCTTDTTSEEK